MIYCSKHLNTFIANCKKFEYKRVNGFEPSITALMDWSDDELLSLGDLSVHYSGISTIYEAIPINQHEYSSQRQSTEYRVGSLIE